jgi:hypothetical protein
MESLIGASCITKFCYQVYDVVVLCMSRALIQRMSISMCRLFLKTLEFSCRPYPQCVLELHEVVVLPCALVLLSLWVGNLEPNN